jgi:rhamnosyltransferase
MNKNLRVAILMATYNGSSFIKEQINSILQQSFVDWDLIIRDDGSTDGTKEILSKFSKNEHRINILNCDELRLGACLNFSKLIDQGRDYKYLVFCDQDDIWLSNKLEEQIMHVANMENKHGVDAPILLYGTYLFIDAEGNVINNKPPDYSFIPNYRYLMVQNYLYGCTMLINNKLAEYLCNIPKESENHDYWIALVALALNSKIHYISEPLLFYRQHAANVSSNIYQKSFRKRIIRYIRKEDIYFLKKRLSMLDILLERFKHVMLYEDQKLISGYIKALSNGGFQALEYSIQHGVRNRFFWKTVLFYVNLLRMKS